MHLWKTRKMLSPVVDNGTPGSKSWEAPSDASRSGRYHVDNEAIPSVPMTGAFDNWKTFVPIILAMALFIGVGVYQMKRKKKPAK